MPAPAQAGHVEAHWNWPPPFGPLRVIRPDRAALGCGIDDRLPLPVPTTAFLVRDDPLGRCAPVCFGGKPPQPATPVSGVLFRPDGSGTGGDRSGCGHPVAAATWPGMLGATCTGLPACPSTDPNRS